MASEPSEKPEPKSSSILEILYPNSQRYIFVFKQGFKKTNIHATEFLYLLQMHTRFENANINPELQIVSSKDLKEAADQYTPLINSLTDADGRIEVIQSFVRFFGNKAVVDFNMTTATLFVPENCTVNFRAIVAESGYIHSFGNYITSENLRVINAESLDRALRYAVNIASDENKKTMIVPYCHEDFTTRDRQKSMFLSDGLDEIKFHMSKAYVGEHRLHNFLADFVARNDNDVCLAPANYELSREAFLDLFPDYVPSTVWIVNDFGLRDDELSQSQEKILLVYRQILKNENFYHFYEENKPAWASHTTLPHSLAGAMINLARRWLPSSESQICDPFSGSGTVFLESQKFTGLRCKSYDLSHLNIEVIGDNIRFFQQDLAQLETLLKDLEAFENANPADPMARKDTPSDRLKTILEVVRDWRSSVKGDDFLSLTQMEVENGFNLLGGGLSQRIALYCALRAAVRGSVDFQRDISTWDEVFKREIRALKAQIRNHLKELKQIGGSIQKDSVTIGRGSYSEQILPPLPSGISDDLFSLKEFARGDVKDLPEGIFDAIVCDPPYGFNTEENKVEIIKFAELLVRKLVEALKPDGGQIIMALPRYSYTGREIPLALRSDQIARRLIDYCLMTGRECWRPSLVLPYPLTNFINPPYYWKSEKALVRKILHFWVSPARRKH